MKPMLEFKKIRKAGLIFTIFLIAIVVVGLAWAVNKVFGYRISDAMIAAAIAAISLIYEINKSKKLNEAEFLVHLNSLFITNDDYKQVYNLLSNYDFENEPDFHQEISNCDISNYLTLFETLYILLKRKVIDIALLDDLFAYRFFLAAHNPYIQRKKLAVSPRNFKNIFRLERIWLNYRKHQTNKDNYFSQSYHLMYRSHLEKYLLVFDDRIQAQIRKELAIKPLDKKIDYQFKPIEGVTYLSRILELQEKAVNEANQVHQGMLRRNTLEMLEACLNPPHVVLGVFQQEELIGFGILYDPTVDEMESIKKELDLSIEKRIKAIPDQKIMHIKLVIIDSKHRGHHLQIHIKQKLEEIARNKQKLLLLTTVSPFNVASVKNTFKSGFTYKKTVKKYDGAVRLIYAKELLDPPMKPASWLKRKLLICKRIFKRKPASST